LRSSAHAATDVGDPLTISPMTRLVVDGGPSDTRTTLTSAPLAVNPSASAALNVASPHGVGGYVLRMLKLGAPRNPWPTTGNADDERVESVIKGWSQLAVVTGVSGVSGCSAWSAAVRLTHPGLAGFPTDLTIHPQGRHYETGSPNAVDGIMLIVRHWHG
jgi:hypothetical protein